MSKAIFDLEFNSLMEDLKKEHLRLGMKASGDWIDSLEVSTTELSGTLKGNSYSEQLETGRKPTSGRGGGGETLLSKIKKWIVDKGIVNRIKGNITVSSLAFIITRKIHKEGWKRKDHGGVNLISNIVTDKRMQDIIDQIGSSMALSFAQKLTDKLKTIK